ncbi:coiled-coil domain-containing protein 62 isoform X2 [Danio rerio]|uniref:Coiled-coil domain-containing protein 62 isoform X2 n=1 Tax=Danio rerio TaxID=7955 RepID=A0AC58GJI4_DANRE
MMEELRDRRHGKSPASFSSLKEHPVEPWHSTPVKKNLFAAHETPEVSSSKHRDEARVKPALLNLHDLSKPASSFTFTQDLQSAGSGVEVSTVQRQRLELQLLIAELKDRDQELNTMAAAHHKQMLIWEQERQRVLILEQRSARLEDELQKRNDVIRALSRRLQLSEAREKHSERELNSTQQQLHELSQRQMNTSRHEQDLEDRNESLKSTVLMLSTQVGQLQVREEELSSMLKLKDKDVIEATNHILELSGRVCELEKTLEELRTRDGKTQRDAEEHKQRFRESRYQNTQLKAELQEKTIENNSQREELIRLKQENQLLRKEISAVELQMINEDKSWRDELLELSRSKQTRADSELLCLRQVCENQQNDLQLLKLNLESTREALRHHEGQRSRDRPDSGLGDSCALEYSLHADAEIETGLISSASVVSQHSSAHMVSQHACAETQTVEQADVEQDQQCLQMQDSAAELDIMAVIDYDEASGTPVCVIDLDFSPRIPRTDLDLLHLDCPASSHGSRRSSVCLHDSTVNIELCGKEEGD